MDTETGSGVSRGTSRDTVERSEPFTPAHCAPTTEFGVSFLRIVAAVATTATIGTTVAAAALAAATLVLQGEPCGITLEWVCKVLLPAAVGSTVDAATVAVNTGTPVFPHPCLRAKPEWWKLGHASSTRSGCFGCPLAWAAPGAPLSGFQRWVHSLGLEIPRGAPLDTRSSTPVPASVSVSVSTLTPGGRGLDSDANTTTGVWFRAVEPVVPWHVVELVAAAIQGLTACAAKAKALVKGERRREDATRSALRKHIVPAGVVYLNNSIFVLDLHGVPQRDQDTFHLRVLEAVTKIQDKDSKGDVDADAVGDGDGDGDGEKHKDACKDEPSEVLPVAVARAATGQKNRWRVQESSNSDFNGFPCEYLGNLFDKLVVRMYLKTPRKNIETCMSDGAEVSPRFSRSTSPSPSPSLSPSPSPSRSCSPSPGLSSRHDGSSISSPGDRRGMDDGGAHAPRPSVDTASSPMTIHVTLCGNSITLQQAIEAVEELLRTAGFEAARVKAKPGTSRVPVGGGQATLTLPFTVALKHPIFSIKPGHWREGAAATLCGMRAVLGSVPEVVLPAWMQPHQRQHRIWSGRRFLVQVNSTTQFFVAVFPGSVVVEGSGTRDDFIVVATCVMAVLWTLRVVRLCVWVRPSDAVSSEDPVRAIEARFAAVNQSLSAVVCTSPCLVLPAERPDTHAHGCAPATHYLPLVITPGAPFPPRKCLGGANVSSAQQVVPLGASLWSCILTCVARTMGHE